MLIIINLLLTYSSTVLLIDKVTKKRDVFNT